MACPVRKLFISAGGRFPLPISSSRCWARQRNRNRKHIWPVQKQAARGRTSSVTSPKCRRLMTEPERAAIVVGAKA